MEMNILDINRKVIFVFSSNTYANIFLKEMLSFFFCNEETKCNNRFSFQIVRNNRA